MSVLISKINMVCAPLLFIINYYQPDCSIYKQLLATSFFQIKLMSK